MFDPDDTYRGRLQRLLAEDPRYSPEAYLFVRESLAYAQEVLGLGAEGTRSESSGEQGDRHLTGQQLCEACRLYALEQYGLMAQKVLQAWGVRTTGDLGEIVYNLIRVNVMKKSDQDRREDFNDVFDFQTAFDRRFRFAEPHRKP
jgi:uncharacterized repeat protein (TIGR04138 family)